MKVKTILKQIGGLYKSINYIVYWNFPMQIVGVKGPHASHVSCSCKAPHLALQGAMEKASSGINPAAGGYLLTNLISDRVRDFQDGQ